MCLLFNWCDSTSCIVLILLRAFRWVAVPLFDQQVSAVAFRIIHGGVKLQIAFMGSNKEPLFFLTLHIVKTVNCLSHDAIYLLSDFSLAPIKKINKIKAE